MSSSDFLKRVYVIAYFLAGCSVFLESPGNLLVMTSPISILCAEIRVSLWLHIHMYRVLSIVSHHSLKKEKHSEEKPELFYYIYILLLGLGPSIFLKMLLL